MDRIKGYVGFFIVALGVLLILNLFFLICSFVSAWGVIDISTWAQSLNISGIIKLDIMLVAAGITATLLTLITIKVTET